MTHMDPWICEGSFHTLDSWLRQVERQSGKMLLVIRTDNAAEFVALRPWPEEKGIELEFIEAETQPRMVWQNNTITLIWI